MKRNLFYLFGVLVLATLATGIFLFVRARPGVPGVLNNQRPHPPEQYEQWRREEAAFYSIVPRGSTFSNAVAILGRDFTIVSNDSNWFYAEFKYPLRGGNPLSIVTVVVRSNIAKWHPGFPKVWQAPKHEG